MKLKVVFSLLEHLAKRSLQNRFGDFSKILFFPPLVDIYGYPLFSNKVYGDGH